MGLWEAARHQPPEAVVGLAREWQMRGLLGEPRRGRRPATDVAARGPVCLARGDRASRGPPVGECGFPPCGAQGQRGATAANGGSEGRLLRRARRGGWGHQLPANGPGPAALGDPGAASPSCGLPCCLVNDPIKAPLLLPRIAEVVFLPRLLLPSLASYTLPGPPLTILCSRHDCLLFLTHKKSVTLKKSHDEYNPKFWILTS